MKTYQLIYKALLLVFWPIGSLMDLLGAMQQWRSETGRKSCRNKIIFIDLLMCICIQISYFNKVENNIKLFYPKKYPNLFDFQSL